jgi:hypothetical protein
MEHIGTAKCIRPPRVNRDRVSFSASTAGIPPAAHPSSADAGGRLVFDRDAPAFSRRSREDYRVAINLGDRKIAHRVACADDAILDEGQAST